MPPAVLSVIFVFPMSTRPSSTDPSSHPTETDRDPASPGTIRAWQVAGLLLGLSLVGLGLYGVWSTLTGQAKEEAAKKDAEAPASNAAIDAVVARRVDFPLRTRASGRLVPSKHARPSDRLDSKSGGAARVGALRGGAAGDAAPLRPRGARGRYSRAAGAGPRLHRREWPRAVVVRDPRRPVGRLRRDHRRRAAGRHDCRGRALCPRPRRTGDDWGRARNSAGIKKEYSPHPI